MRGFSLIELIVSLGIMAMITAMGVWQFGNFSENKKLEAEANALAVKVNEIKIMALSGQKVNDERPLAIGLGEASKEKDAYFLFGDKNGNCAKDAEDDVFETIFLANNIKFKSSGAYTIDENNVCFKTLKTANNVCDSGGKCGSGKARFKLISEKTEKEIQVIVNLANGMAKVGE